MYFKGFYYDGKSSFGHPATIVLTETTITITLASETLTRNIEQLNITESHVYDDRTVLKFGNQFPYEAVEITEADFPVFFERTYPSFHLKKTKIKSGYSTGIKSIASIITGIIALILLSYFYIIPFMAETVAKRIPQEYEIELGSNLFSQVVESYQVDSTQSALANSFFNELNVNQNYPVTIYVVHSEISNAFAFPGGNIVVHDKLLKAIDSKEEFAALLAHEYSHVAYRHTTRSLFRNLGTYLVVSLLLTDVNGVMAVLLQNADNLKSLSYSRALEEEADTKGLELLLDAGVNPRGMLDLFTQLEKESDGAGEIPEFLSTHPMLQQRKVTITQLIAKSTLKLKPNEELEQLWKQIKQNN